MGKGLLTFRASANIVDIGSRYPEQFAALVVVFRQQVLDELLFADRFPDRVQGYRYGSFEIAHAPYPS